MRWPAAALVIIAFGAVTTPAGAHPVIPDLRMGDRGGEVATWQRTLDASVPGVHVEQDGVFGPLTDAATRRFEQRFQVPVTGVVGWSARTAWVGASVTCCGAVLPTLAKGDFSPYVAWVQISLDRWLPEGDALIPDGLYGPRTVAAVTRFQAASGLVADGIDGSKTWSRIFRDNISHIP